MERHKKLKNKDEDIFGNSEEEMELSIDDYDGDTDIEKIDHWESIVKMVYGICQSEFESNVQNILGSENISVDEARGGAFEDLRPTFRKADMDTFTKRMVQFNAMKNERVFKRIKQTVRQLLDNEGFDSDEAWKYAISTRKYIFDKVLDSFNLPESTQVTITIENDAKIANQPPAKQMKNQKLNMQNQL